MQSTKLTVSTTVDKDINTVWDCYTQPQHITQWNFATDDWQCPTAENDLQAGGKYKARMEAKDGSFGFDFEAIYDEVEDKKKLAYTMTDGRQAITDFKDVNGKTIVTTAFDPESVNPVEMQQQGWQMILENFRKYSETR
ncbi:MAG TPA: SRPBCC family protein [Flavipsychrobacter sp.]|nr:SRPBCC family protein [Flavipsychrobacter sp.]